MYKRHSSQMSLYDEPKVFGTLPLDPNNIEFNLHISQFLGCIDQSSVA